MDLYFIRHGETNWNKRKKMQGQVNIPLTQMGREAAIKTGRRLATIRFDTAFSSPLSRALDTAQLILGDSDLTIEKDDRLLEMSYGICEGQSKRLDLKFPWNKTYNYLHAPDIYRPPEGGESFEDLRVRCQDFLQTRIFPLVRDDSCECVLIATHTCVIRTIVCSIRGIPVCDFWKGIPQGYCAITKIRLKDERLEVLEESKCYYE